MRVWRSRTKILVTLVYVAAVAIYLYIGFQPVDAVDTSGLPTLSIPAISLTTPVEQSTVKDRELSVPDRIAGVYSTDPSKLLFIGHSATVFHELKNLHPGDQITYQDTTYQITDMTEKTKVTISMQDVLAPASQPTIVLMTCSGQPLGNNDYTHRLIITAVDVATISQR